METFFQQIWCSCSRTTSLLLPAHKVLPVLEYEQAVQGKKYQHKLLRSSYQLSYLLIGTMQLILSYFALIYWRITRCTSAVIEESRSAMQNSSSSLLCVNLNYFLHLNSTEIEAKLCGEAAHALGINYFRKILILDFSINT